MNKENILTILVVLAILVGGNYLYSYLNAKVEVPVQDSDITTVGAERFSGKLENVDTGCFVDGECYIVVDKKHVTLIMGWSQETVGSIVGVESIGDLESHIGKEIEVYARKNDDGSYTLYGDKNFYVKLK